MMGKHDLIKSTSRVAKHRAAMQAKGYRLKQMWVPDLNDPAIKAEIERANRAIADFERRNPDEARWMDGLVTQAWNDLPD